MELQLVEPPIKDAFLQRIDYNLPVQFVIIPSTCTPTAIIAQKLLPLSSLKTVKHLSYVQLIGQLLAASQQCIVCMLAKDPDIIFLPITKEEFSFAFPHTTWFQNGLANYV